MSALLELAERCQKATGPDRELECAIFDACFGKPHLTDTAYHARAYTASLDAATTLVPEGEAVFWRVGNDGEGGNPADFKAQVMVCSMLTAQHSTAVAETAPLALCAAALRSRAAMSPHKDELRSE